MGFSNYLENKVLDLLFGSTAYSVPGTLYIGLSTDTIDDTTTGSTVVEPSGGAYARVAVTNDKTTWSTASNGSVQNDIDILFPEATASWGTVTHMFIADAVSGGNILVWGALTTTKAIGVGDTAKFSAGDLVINLD
jgi:hypothetical protein